MKNKYLYIFYLFGSIVLIYILSVNNDYTKVLNILILDFVFILLFYLKYKKSENLLFYLRLTFYLIFINHLTLLSFIIVQFKGIKVHYYIYFQFVFFLYLLLTSRKNLNYLNILVLFALLVTPVSLLYDHYFFGEYSIFLFFLIILEILINRNIFLILKPNKIGLLYIFYIILLLIGIVQFFYVIPKGSIIFHWFKFFIYLVSFLSFLYFFKNNRHFDRILYVLSSYISIQLFFITLMIFLHKNNIIGKANENFFAMYFDWSIFFILLGFFQESSRKKKIVRFLFLIITFFFCYYVIILFDAETTMLAIPLTIILVLAKYYWDKLNLSNDLKNNLYLFIFVFIYICLYFVLFYYAVYSQNSSIMTRFFYWYVIMQYFIKNPQHIFFGLGEYEWGFLYKYLTFDINTFPYLAFTDYKFFFGSHAHNDIISFLIGGGLVFLGIYFYIIYKIFHLKIFNIRDYVLFSIIVIGIFHGITEPFMFSQYTGYIFWFIAVVLLYRNQQLEFDFLNKSFRPKIQNLKRFIKIFIYISIIFNLYFFVKLELKRNVYLDYYYNKTLDELKYFYEVKREENIDTSKRINQIQEKINLLKVLVYISPWEKENYSILADYWINLYVYQPDRIYLKNAYQNSCKSFYLNPLVKDYDRVNVLIYREKIENDSFYCKHLEKFDPYNLLEINQSSFSEKK